MLGATSQLLTGRLAAFQLRHRCFIEGFKTHRQVRWADEGRPKVGFGNVADVDDLGDGHFSGYRGPVTEILL